MLRGPPRQAVPSVVVSWARNSPSESTVAEHQVGLMRRDLGPASVACYSGVVRDVGKRHGAAQFHGRRDNAAILLEVSCSLAG